MAFVTDSFTDTNGTLLSSHTGETGATLDETFRVVWGAHHPGTSRTGSTGQSQRTRILYYASGAPASADYDVEMDLVCVGTTDTGTAFGVLGRVATGAETSTG